MVRIQGISSPKRYEEQFGKTPVGIDMSSWGQRAANNKFQWKGGIILLTLLTLELW